MASPAALTFGDTFPITLPDGTATSLFIRDTRWLLPRSRINGTTGVVVLGCVAACYRPA